MRIRFVIPGFWLGGGPRNIYSLASQLSKKGHNASVLFLCKSLRSHSRPNKPDVSAHARLEYFMKPLSYINQLAYVTSRKIQWLIPIEEVIYTASLLASTEPAIYVATAWETAIPVIKASQIKRQPSMYFVQAFETTFSKKIINKQFANKTYMSPSIRFTQSAWLKRFLEENYAAKTYYVGMGINHNIFRPAKEVQHKPRIVTIARTDPNKGFHVFVEAIRRLHKMRDDFEVIIIGEKAAVDSQKLDFPYKYAGWITDDHELANLYQGSVFVNTGKHEALPMPPLEAMACGATVVITDTEGAREYTTDKQNCLLSSVGDPKALAQRLDEAISNEALRDRLSKNAILTASRYTWDATVLKFEDMMKNEGIV